MNVEKNECLSKYYPAETGLNSADSVEEASIVIESLTPADHGSDEYCDRDWHCTHAVAGHI